MYLWGFRISGSALISIFRPVGYKAIAHLGLDLFAIFCALPADDLGDDVGTERLRPISSDEDTSAPRPLRKRIDDGYACFGKIAFVARCNSESDLTQNDRINDDLRFMGAQPVDHACRRLWPSGLTQHVGVDKIGHKVSVDSDSIGTKYPFSGHASSQSTSPSLAGGSLRTRR